MNLTLELSGLNLERLLRAAGACGVRMKNIRRMDERTMRVVVPAAQKKTVVVISADHMGEGDEVLGKILLKGFLFALTQQEMLPKTVLFYNGGAKLTTEGSVSLEDLRSMEAQGVQILTCGTCLNFYGLADKLAVGSVTNMYVIVETLAKAGKVIKP